MNMRKVMDGVRSAANKLSIEPDNEAFRKVFMKRCDLILRCVELIKATLNEDVTDNSTLTEIREMGE